MQIQIRWLAGGLFLALVSTRLEADVTLDLVPQGSTTVESGSQITFEAFISSDGVQQIKSGRIGLPCTVTGGAGSTGALTLVGLTTDPDADGILGPSSGGTPFLFFPPLGLGSVNFSQCFIVASPTPGGPTASLAAGESRYLGTAVYDIPCDASGSFLVNFAGVSHPPTPTDSTRFRDASPGAGQLISLIVPGTMLLVSDPAGTCCDGLSCTADSVSRCACAQISPGATFFPGRTCMDAVSCGCATDAECNDGIACSGTRACDTITRECYVAEAGPSCNDGDACTLDSCNGTHAYADADGCVSLAEGKLYWTDTGTDRIRRSDVDGLLAENVVMSLAAPKGVAIDADAGKVYWTDADTDRIQRSNLDGSGVEDVITSGLVDPEGIAVDPAAGKIYWADPGLDCIQRANLDGSNVETVVPPGAVLPRQIAMDVAAGKMYWTDVDLVLNANVVRCANLDGTDIEHLFSTWFSGSPGGSPGGVALDVAAGKLFVTSWEGKLFRANLDGSSVEVLMDLDEVGFDRHIAVDPAGGKVYWTQFFHQGGGVFISRIWRAGLDGSNPEILISTELNGFTRIDGLVLDPSAGHMYFPTWPTPAGIHRSNLDGSDITLFSTHSVVALNMDFAAGKMYWIAGVLGVNGVQRANFDGSNVETLVVEDTQHFQINGLKVEPGLGKLYMLDWAFHAIRQANLDGSNFEELVVASALEVHAVSLDAGNGKIYWAQGRDDVNIDSMGAIGRADLDGSNSQRLVAGLVDPRGIAVDAAGGRVYWTDSGTSLVQRAFLDGTGVQTLANTGIGRPYGITYDAVESKLYYVTAGSEPAAFTKIQRANPDGTGVQNVITAGLSVPVGIAVLHTECCVLFGDVFPPEPALGSSVIDVDDILYVIGGFMDPTKYPAADLYPCGGDGLVDVDDILIELAAFAGDFACLDRCGP